MIPITPVAEIDVIYKPAKGWDNQPVILTKEDAYSALCQFFPDDIVGLQEQFVVMYLSRDNRIKAVYRHSTGSMTGTLADLRIILGTALKLAATGLIVAHNHPSGNPRPSETDRDLTEKLSKAAELLDLSLLDHLIITPQKDQYLSFADQGLL